VFVVCVRACLEYVPFSVLVVRACVRACGVRTRCCAFLFEYCACVFVGVIE